MKAHNATMQERAHWDTILGTYQNNLLNMPKKLKKDLREVHFSEYGDVCREVKSLCEKAAHAIQYHRYRLGDIART